MLMITKEELEVLLCPLETLLIPFCTDERNLCQQRCLDLSDDEGGDSNGSLLPSARLGAPRVVRKTTNKELSMSKRFHTTKVTHTTMTTTHTAFNQVGPVTASFADRVKDSCVQSSLGFSLHVKNSPAEHKKVPCPSLTPASLTPLRPTHESANVFAIAQFSHKAFDLFKYCLTQLKPYALEFASEGLRMFAMDGHALLARDMFDKYYVVPLSFQAFSVDFALLSAFATRQEKFGFQIVTASSTLPNVADTSPSPILNSLPPSLPTNFLPTNLTTTTLPADNVRVNAATGLQGALPQSTAPRLVMQCCQLLHLPLSFIDKMDSAEIHERQRAQSVIGAEVGFFSFSEMLDSCVGLAVTELVVNSFNAKIVLTAPLLDGAGASLRKELHPLLSSEPADPLQKGVSPNPALHFTSVVKNLVNIPRRAVSVRFHRSAEDKLVLSFNFGSQSFVMQRLEAEFK
jgi:hypothetical protein